MQVNSFGHWLRLRRKALDLTREGLADRVGCSAAAIRKIESEERRPSAQIVARLAEIFDILPSEQPALLRFARGDWNAAPAELLEELPWRTVSKFPRTNIPAEITSFIGREQDLALVRGYLSTAHIRLVTLIGPPGVGKTRLSLEVARAARADFLDGSFFLALAPLEDAALIAPLIVQTLGYGEAKNLPAIRQLLDGIGEKQILLVLDNCEHLIEEVAMLVSDLLSACPRLKILVTSREALRVPGEWVHAVTPLGVPKESSLPGMDTVRQFPALTLFAERARAARSDFSLNPDNLPAVISICRQLDGLPLAIELIAAHMRLMSPQALLERLTDQFVLSANGMRALSARQKTLSAAIGWSYNFLLPEEQRMFAYLAVMPGGFTLEAVISAFSDLFTATIIPELVASLSDKSLLQRITDRCGETRFTMLVTIQQFARNCLRRSGREAEARDRHLAFFLKFAEKGASEIRGPAQAEWADLLESELDNFRSALDWAVSTQNTESALRLLLSLGWPWEVSGHYREARKWLERIRNLPDVHRFLSIYTRVLNHIGRHAWTQGNIQDAHTLLLESQAISQTMGEEGEKITADTLNWLGLVTLYSTGDRQSAKSMFERGLALHRKWGDERGAALSTFHLGIAEIGLDNSAALSLLEESLSTFDQFGDFFFIARVSDFLGELNQKQGNYERAKYLFEQRIRLDQEVKFLDGIVEGWFDLGNLYYQQEKYEQASQCFEQSVIVCREHSLNKFEPLYMSGLLALYRDDYDLASQHFLELIVQTRKSGERAEIGLFLMGLASAFSMGNQLQHAAKLYGAAQAAITALDYRASSKDLNEFDRHLRILRQEIGEAALEALHAEGRAMTVKQAVEYALEISKSVE